MKLDRTLIKELKALIGDGSREAKFNMIAKLVAAKNDLSTTEVRETFTDCLRKHGRAAVAVCVAVTLDDRKERLGCANYEWALTVLSLIPYELTDVFRARVKIVDGIHPTAINDYAGGLIKYTTED